MDALFRLPDLPGSSPAPASQHRKTLRQNRCRCLVSGSSIWVLAEVPFVPWSLGRVSEADRGSDSKQMQVVGSEMVRSLPKSMVRPLPRRLEAPLQLFPTGFALLVS